MTGCALLLGVCLLTTRYNTVLRYSTVLGKATWRLFEHKKRGVYPSLTTAGWARSEEHTSELQSRGHIVCRLLLAQKSSKSMTMLGVRTSAMSTFSKCA